MIDDGDLLEAAACVRAAVTALNAGDWLGAARSSDPVSLRVVQRQLLEMIAPAVPPPVITVDELLRDVPDMPRAVAEYQLDQMRRHQAIEGMLQTLLPSCGSLEEARRMSPEGIFAAWLEGRRDYYQIVQLENRGLAPAGTAALHQAHLIGLDVRLVVLGVVPDGDAVAHVIYRDEPDDPATWGAETRARLDQLPADEAVLAADQMWRTAVRTAMCRRQPDGRWRLVAGFDFLSVGSRFVARVTPPDAEEAPGIA